MELLDGCVISIKEQPLAHGLGVLGGWEGANIQVKQRILWIMTYCDLVSAPIEGSYHCLCVGFMGERHYLYH
jgi:hypothetical protein